MGHRSVCYVTVTCALTASGELLRHQPSCLRSEEEGRRRAAGLCWLGLCLLIGRAKGFPEASPKIPSGRAREKVGVKTPARTSTRGVCYGPFPSSWMHCSSRWWTRPRKQEAAASRARLQGCLWLAREFWKGT